MAIHHKKITRQLLVRRKDIAFVEASGRFASSKPLAVTVPTAISVESLRTSSKYSTMPTLLAYSDAAMDT